MPDHFPIPTADELFDDLGKAKLFTKLESRSGYHQIRMHEANIFKSSWWCVWAYKCLVNFLGSHNQYYPVSSPKMCDSVFYDILVYSPIMESHCAHLVEVLSLQLVHHVKFPKCSFLRYYHWVFGSFNYRWSIEGWPDENRGGDGLAFTMKFKTVVRISGLTGYYRRFVANYAAIAALLTDLLKKGLFAWTTTVGTLSRRLSRLWRRPF